MNVGAPCLTDLATDDAYFTETQLGTMLKQARNSYSWEKDIFNGEPAQDWSPCYKTVYNSNVVLEGLSKLSSKGQEQAYNTTIANALFYRAFAFFNLQEEFGQPYDLNTAESDLGIVLKLNTNLNESVHRSSVKETYDQIIKDLNEALDLFPNNFNLDVITSPIKPAAYALLARVNLSMQQYEEAGRNAKHCLQLYNLLTDYNDINASVSFPLYRQKNVETLFEHTQANNFVSTQTGIDQELYSQYDNNDLRKNLFFRSGTNGSVQFQGFYTYRLNVQWSNGLCVDEVYLISAEAAARVGELTSALNDLNTLLINRYKTGTYMEYFSDNPDTVLDKVLLERRKELLFRGLRWSDLRRLNKEPKFAKTISRSLNDQTISLAPNDPKYAFPIPVEEIKLSGLIQNNR